MFGIKNTVDSDEIAEDFFSKVDALEPQKIDMIEKEFKDAINFAIETYRKMSKFNKEWEEEEN